MVDPAPLSASWTQEEMGFLEGWGRGLEQLVEVARKEEVR
jgi:hypothetical protein